MIKVGKRAPYKFEQLEILYNKIYYRKKNESSEINILNSYCSTINIMRRASEKTEGKQTGTSCVLTSIEGKSF